MSGWNWFCCCCYYYLVFIKREFWLLLLLMCTYARVWTERELDSKCWRPCYIQETYLCAHARVQTERELSSKCWRPCYIQETYEHMKWGEQDVNCCSGSKFKQPPQWRVLQNQSFTRKNASAIATAHRKQPPRQTCRITRRGGSKRKKCPP